MENYLIKKEVFVHESGAFKSIIAMNKKTKKDYLLTIYDLNYYKDKRSQVCEKIISICQTLKLYRCCHVFFDREIYKLESIRPSNIGTFLKKFIVVEPFPMISLADYFDSGKINADAVINGFSYIYKTLSTLHFLNIAYGCLSPLNIIVTNGNFSFRPPNLLKYQCSCTPPPLVARQKYRFKTEIERYPHDQKLTNSKKTDCLCFGYLLCDYILYFGRNISFLLHKKNRNIDSYIQKFQLPPFILTFLKPSNEIFYDESIKRKLKKFLFNRKKLLELYMNHKYVDPSTYNESPIKTKRQPVHPKKLPIRHNDIQNPAYQRSKSPSNRIPKQKNNFNRMSQNSKKHENYKQHEYNPKPRGNRPRTNKTPKNTDFNNNPSDSIEEYQVITQYSDSENNVYNAFNTNKPTPKDDDSQVFTYSDDEVYEQNYECIKNNFDHQNDDRRSLKIDNIECYTINNNMNLNNHDYQPNPNMNLENIAPNNERFSAYSDAYEYNDSDSFIENIEYEENIANYNILDSSNSNDYQIENTNDIKDKPINHPKTPDDQNNHQHQKDLQSQPIKCKLHKSKKGTDRQPIDLKNDFSADSFGESKNLRSFIVRFKFEYDKSKFSEKKFSIHIFTGIPQKSERVNFLTINKKIGEIKHHHVNKEIKLDERLFNKCKKDGITVCVMFNHAVHRDLIHLNLRNISFVPFYDNNLNLMFSVQTTIDVNK